MENEWQTLLQALGFKQSIVAGVLTWMASAGLIVKVLRTVIGEKVGALAERILTCAAKSSAKDDDEYILAVLSSKPYRITAWLFDALLRVRFPSVESFGEMIPKPEAKPD